MKLSGQQLEEEYQREIKIMQSDRYSDCVVHHAISDIPEDEFTRAIYNCKKEKPAAPIIGPQPYIDTLEREGILDRFMVPGDDRWHYELSPVAKYTLKKILERGEEKFNHPKPKNLY